MNKCFNLFALLLIVVFFSCSKDNEVNLNNESYYVEDGILFFKDIDALNEVMENLHSYETSYLPVWENEVK